MRKIKYDNTVILFLSDLTDILIKEEYFSFYETSVEYMWDLISFVENKIHTIPHKHAPPYFAKYGNNLFYILYNRNRNTTWYILFEKTPYHFLIRHISNNHVVGKYFE